jgi:calcium-dependent protein kinase
MIKADPIERITIMEAIHHPWVVGKENDQADEKLNADIIKKLVNFNGESILRKLSLFILVNHLTPEQIAPLKKEFEKVDTDLSGFLELQELEDALEKAQIGGEHHITKEEISNIVS